MKKQKAIVNKVILERDDFSESGLALGLWEALTEGLHISTNQVEVLVIGKYS